MLLDYSLLEYVLLDYSLLDYSGSPLSAYLIGRLIDYGQSTKSNLLHF